MSRQQWQSAVEARRKIQDALPHIMTILKALPPTHAWDFNTSKEIFDSDVENVLEEEEESPIVSDSFTPRTTFRRSISRMRVMRGGYHFQG